MFSLRQKKLKKLADKAGGSAALAKQHGLNADYLYQLVSGRRNIGEKSARKLEAAFSLPDHWFDLDNEYPKDVPIKALIVEEPSNFTKITSKTSVPLISWIRAGGWGEIDDHNPDTSERVDIYRSNPSKSKRDNYSHKGNINPYNGKNGTKD